MMIPEQESWTRQGALFAFTILQWTLNLEYKLRKSHYVGILLKAIQGKKMLEQKGSLCRRLVFEIAFTVKILQLSILQLTTPALLSY